MTNTIIYCVLFLFALIGVIASIYVIMLLIMRPKAAGYSIVVIPPMSTKSDVASLICAARLRLGLMGDIAHREVIALDCGMPEHKRQQCLALCHELDHISLLTPEEFLSKIDKISFD